jgi:hypothetical protein
MSENIGGVEKSEIRKAYFNGKLSSAIAKVQAQGEISIETAKELQEFLQSLKDESKEVELAIKKFMPEPEDERERIFLAEILGQELTEEEKKMISDEKNSYTFAVETVTNKMKERANQYYAKKNLPTIDDLMDDAVLFVSLEYYIDGQEIVLKQLYKKKVAEYITKGNQRKQAEDLAMMSEEYRKWQDTYRLRERMLEYIMLAKKRYSGQFN